jgi:hypothetical protein
MAKHILQNSDADLDFVLVGITSFCDQYEIIAVVDDTLKTKFFLSDYIPFGLKDGNLFKFSLYKYLDEELGLEYYLIPNSSNFEEPKETFQTNLLFDRMDVETSVRLVKELPKTDYFLVLKGEDLLNYQFRIVELLRKCPGVISATALDPMDLPSRRNLIF